MRKNLPLIVGGAVIVVVLMLLFACDLGQLLSFTRPPAQFDPIKTKGNSSATVTLIEYSDFQ
jgi:hypothetical protein